MSGAREIPLSRGMVAIVDVDDFEWVSQWKWSALKVSRRDAPPKFYAARMTRKAEGGRSRMILLHRALMGEPAGMVVDHRDLDTLNDRRSNLRVTSQAKNCLNQKGHRDRSGSKFKGVWWHRQNRKWIADFRGQYLGSFTTELAAAAAYDAVAHAHDPEFARLNLIAGG